jgi:tetratricopeptide (TPR) repeat protein
MLLIAGLACAGSLFAAIPPEVQGLQNDWAEIKYQVPEEKRVAALKKLEAQAQSQIAQHPTAEGKVWHAIILSTLAGEEGGLGALELVTRARDLLIEAEKMDPDTLNGSVYTSLGSLYYQVPGWPVGFGDDDKARQYLTKALKINPDGIDPNYFYGDFLLDQGDYDEAISYLQKALQAPARPGREVADQGRKQEIEQALAKAKEKKESHGFGW